MPCVTYLNEWEKKNWTVCPDKDIDELLQAARKIEPKWLICERVRTTPRIFRKPIVTKLYELYYDCDFEQQIINFAQDHDWSINYHVTKSYIMTFFFGYLARREIKDQP